MSTINTLLIKRRLPNSPLGAGAPVSLSGGELAFNEIDLTLYYGASSGILPIAGPGAFVSRTLAQDVSGTKTFKDTTIFDAGVTINSTLDVNDTIEANSYTITGVEVIDSSRNAYFANISASGDLTVQGNLNVLGATTTIETDVTTTSAFEITNNGSQTALTVTQVDGSNDVAEFKDGTDTALIVKGSGNVGVGTFNPNEKLTVVGSISATQNIYLDSADFTGTLEVDNATTLNSTLDVIGASTFASTLSTQGAVEFDSTLQVDGATTLNNTLDVIGASTFASTLSTQGAVEFDSTLQVDGATTLNSTLYVVQDSTFVANISGQMGVSSIINFIIDGGQF